MINFVILDTQPVQDITDKFLPGGEALVHLTVHLVLPLEFTLGISVDHKREHYIIDNRQRRGHKEILHRLAQDRPH